MIQKKIKKIRPNFLLKLRPILRWIIKLRSSPHAIAGGLGLGVFIAFTPTYGVQLFLAVVLATFFNLNRPAAIIPVWITNPVTIAPVYTFNYWVGCFAWPGPPVGEVYQTFLSIAGKLARLDFWDFQNQIVEFISIGKEVLVPLVTGSVVVGGVLGVISYVISKRLLIFIFSRRARKKKLS